MLVILMRGGGREHLTATILRFQDFVLFIRIREFEVPWGYLVSFNRCRNNTRSSVAHHANDIVTILAC